MFSTIDYLTHNVSHLGYMINFTITSFLWSPRRKEVRGKEVKRSIGVFYKITLIYKTVILCSNT